jgi:ribulose-phosphate 3-epimerase
MSQTSGKNILNQLHEVVPTISVGMLTADLMSLGKEIAILENTDVKLLHFDVMDGCFVPKTTFGPPLIKAIKTTLFKDVHLMIKDPLEKINDYVAAGADMITVHVESDLHIHRVLQALGTMKNVNNPDRGIIRGVALNPGTAVETILPVIDEIDMIFLLAVNPGFDGQKFIPATQKKLEQIKKIIKDSKKDVLIGVDGGINRANIADVAKMGADIIVTGSAVFDGKAVAENARVMLNLAKGKN